MMPLGQLDLLDQPGWHFMARGTTAAALEQPPPMAEHTQDGPAAGPEAETLELPGELGWPYRGYVA